MKTDQNEIIRQHLQNLSVQDFLSLGMQEIAYIRPAQIDGKSGYLLHAADGTPLHFQMDRETLMMTAKQNELNPFTVQ